VSTAGQLARFLNKNQAEGGDSNPHSGEDD